MAVNRQKIWQINFNKYNAVGGGLKCCHPLNYKNTTVNQSPPHVGERGNFLWIAQKHTRNTSCILSTVSAKSSYAMPLSTHGATGTGGGKEKYPLNHTHQWRACCSPVIFAREKEGNHLPLFFRELHTAGNRKLWNFNNAESLFYIISDIETVVYESAHFQYKNLSGRYSNNM